MTQLPIDVVPGSSPPRFRWRQAVNGTNGRTHVDCEGLIAVAIEGAVEEAVDLLKRTITERDKLLAFKTWVHAYLDARGVPHHPPGTHGAAGCRIGDRLDHVFAELESLRDRVGCPVEDGKATAPKSPPSRGRRG